VIVKVLKKYFFLAPIFLTLSLSFLDDGFVIYCHVFMSFYCLLIISISPLRDIRVCILIFSILYSFFINLSVYFFNTTDLGQGSSFLFTNITPNAVNMALNYNLFWLAGIMIHLLINTEYLHQKLVDYYTSYKNDNSRIKSKSIDYLIIFIFSLWLLSVTRLDWGRINDEYTLEGVGMTFGLNYILFAYISARLLTFKSLQFLDYFILLFIVAIFSLIGARQPLFWGFIMLGSVYTFVRFKNNLILFNFIKIKNLFKYSIIALIIIIIFSLIVWYRVSRDPRGIYEILINLEFGFLFSLFLRLLVAETLYTFYNLMAVMQHNLNGISNFGTLIYDFWIQLIPSFILQNKYQLMETYKIVNRYDLSPFGTSYVVGTLALAASSPLLIAIYAYLYCSFIKWIIRILFSLSRTYSERIVIYCLFYVFSGAYIIRGSIFGGVKLALTISLIFIFFSVLGRFKLSKKIN
jgi:hypothetical protein